MGYTTGERRGIWQKTAGRCHLCKRRLALGQYGLAGARSAWEVDHSTPRAAGGTERWSNLLPACVPCNRSKQDKTTLAKRSENGFRRKPLLREERATEKRAAAAKGVTAGAVIGAIFGGPAGAAVGSLIGGLVGHAADPEE